MLNFSLVLLCLLVSPVNGPTPTIPDGASWQYLPGKGFLITHRATNPGTPAGTVLETAPVFSYTITYPDGRTSRHRYSGEPSKVTVALDPDYRATWVYTRNPDLVALIDAGYPGEGGMELDSETVTVWVTAPNDGKQHSFTWLLVRSLP